MARDNIIEKGTYTWPDGATMTYEINNIGFIFIHGELRDGPISLDTAAPFWQLVLEVSTSVGASNFSGWSMLVRVVIKSKSITHIGEDAFSNCPKLDYMQLGSVSSIGKNAFRNCPSLHYVEIPDSMKSIDDQAFEECDNLKLAVMPRSHWVELGKDVFSKDVKQIDRPYRNRNNAWIVVDEIRPNEYRDYCGCTVDIHLTVYSAWYYARKFSFWLLNQDTGWTGESIMDGIYESELEWNEDFNEDMNLCDIYSEEKLEEMAWDQIMDGYEFIPEDCDFLDYVFRIEDVLVKKVEDWFEDNGDVNDPDIDKLLSPDMEDFWPGIEVEDLIDFEAMAEDGDVYCPWGRNPKDYADMVEDFEASTVYDASNRITSVEVPESAVEYCRTHPADCLLLPYAICLGMKDTHFVQSRDILNNVVRIFEETDWTDFCKAEKALLSLRSYILKTLKKRTRWVDIENNHFARYENSNDEIDQASVVLESLCKVLEALCPEKGRNLSCGHNLELGLDKSRDIRMLRDEYGLVIPEKLAYDFLVGRELREQYSKEILHRESNYYDSESYEKPRLALIKEDVFSIIEDRYLNDVGTASFFDAALTLKEYEGESFVEQLLEAEDEDDYLKEEDGCLSLRGITYNCYDKVYRYGSGDEELGYMRIEVTGFGEGRHREVVHIPSSVKYKGEQYPVTAINTCAFNNCTDIRKVIIDDGLTEISEDAFRGCTGLCNIILPASLKSLGTSSFKGCTSLKTVFIPAGVNDIETNCFEDCSQLEEILVDENNQTFKSVDGVLCDRRSGQRIYVPDANKALDEDEPVTHGPVIEEGEDIFSVDGIRYELRSSFYWDQENHEHIEITGLRVLPIEENNGYSGVVEIPSRIKYRKRWREVLEVRNGAFKDCPDLLEVRIPHTVRNFLGNVSGSPRLTAVNVDSENKIYTSIDGVVYDKSLSTIVCYPHGHGEEFEIPSTVWNIDSAFSGCSVLRKIIISGRFERIWSGAFSECTNLESVIIGEGIKLIRSNAFKDCTSLKEIVLPESIEEVESWAFAGCMALEKITFPKDRYFNLDGIPQSLLPWGHEPFEKDGVLYAPYHAYEGAEALLAVISPRNDAPALVQHSEVEELFIPAVVERNGFTYKVTWCDSAFEQFPNLLVLHLPKYMRAANLKYIPSLLQVIVSEDNETLSSEDGFLYNKDKTILMGAPRGLKNKKLVIRDGVEIIGTKRGAMTHEDRLLEEIFADREELEEVILPDSVKVIGEGAFRNCTSLRTVKLGEGVEEIYSNAFGNTALERINLPRSLKYVGQKKFSGPRPFSQCGKLAAFEMDEESDLLKVIDGVLYQKTSSGLVLICCPPAYSGILTIPDGVVSISDDACAVCEELIRVEMPDSVEHINSWAFGHCSKLEHVRISKNLRYVGSCAFCECTSLKEVDFTLCKYYFGYDDFDTCAFQYCDGIKLKLPESLERRRQYIERDIKHRVTAAELDATDWM